MTSVLALAVVGVAVSTSFALGLFSPSSAGEFLIDDSVKIFLFKMVNDLRKGKEKRVNY